MMNIIALTDLHGRSGMFRDLSLHLQSADIVILCGDITHFGHRNDMASMINALRQFNSNILAVSGNCDYPEVEQYLSEENLSISFTTKEINGVAFTGLSGSLPCPGKTVHEYTEEEYEAILSDISVPVNRTSIVVSHQPPYNTVNDTVSPGNHVGSKTIRYFIERTNPLLCFTGHIHEGKGIDHINRTAIVNPGPAFTGGYALAEIGSGMVRSLSIRNINDND